MLTVQQGKDETDRAFPNREVPQTVEEKWAAIQARDASTDGSFVFAVRSTRIYCKPSCPARRARPNQIVFFAEPDEAERSGYRPCERCKPRDNHTSSKTGFVGRACKYIDTHLEGKLTLPNISARVGVSPFYLQRTFKKALGISPREYVDARRLASMRRLLKKGETVTEALYNAGFTSRSRLYEKTHSRFGMSPGEVRRGGDGYQIEYTIIDCPLGRLLLGATERGLCTVCIGNSDVEVETALAEDYPLAELRRIDQANFKWASKFKEYFAGQQLPEDLPIDVVATAFQWRVWSRIRSIPYGKTLTYSAMARTLGNPRGARAVARVCAANHVALLIPCHRIIGADGELRGYRWGEKRKRALLELEQRNPSPSS